MDNNPYLDPQFINRYFKKRERSKTTLKRRLKETKLIKRLLVFANILPPAKLLDLPCGDGWLSQDLFVNGYEIISSDSSPLMIQGAIQKYRVLENKTVCANILDLPFSDESFDLVVSIRLFHHLNRRDRKKALEEIRRVAKKGVILTFFNSYSIHALWNSFRGIESGRHEISLNQLRNEGREVGLILRKTLAPWSYLKRNWFVYLEKK